MNVSVKEESLVLPDFSGEEIAVLKKYFEFNKRYQEELNEEVQNKLRDHPVFGPMMRMMTPAFQASSLKRDRLLCSQESGFPR